MSRIADRRSDRRDSTPLSWKTPFFFWPNRGHRGWMAKPFERGVFKIEAIVGQAIGQAIHGDSDGHLTSVFLENCVSNWPVGHGWPRVAKGHLMREFKSKGSFMERHSVHEQMANPNPTQSTFRPTAGADARALAIPSDDPSDSSVPSTAKALTSSPKND
jgi:hypothetical protein